MTPAAQIIRHTVTYSFDSPLFFAIIGAMSGAIAALFSMLIWVVYRNQLVAMREALVETRKSNDATQESNRIAKTSVELGNRAWMVATDIERLVIAAGPARKLWVNTENLGRIPAIDVSVRGLAFTFTGPPLPDLPEDLSLPSTGYYASRAVAGPGRGLQGKIELGALTDDIVARIVSGELVLFAFCVIEYIDWFAVPRETTACWQYNREDGSWAAAPRHNRMK